MTGVHATFIVLYLAVIALPRDTMLSYCVPGNWNTLMAGESSFGLRHRHSGTGR